MTVRDGRLVLPDGMSYRVLVLPESPTMTVALLNKIKDLVEAGATVVGPRPVRAPGLSGYPQSDATVQRIASELWGDCDGQKVKEHRLGLGRVVCGVAPESLLAGSGVGPDFSTRSNLRYIHRALGTTDLYFVSNPLPSSQNAVCSFRVTGKQPEFWWPDTGRIEAAPMFTTENGTTRVVVPLEPSGSVFVVFRNHADAPSSIVSVTHDGKAVLSTAVERPSKIVVRKAVYGVLGDPRRTRDVRAKVQQIVDAGEDRFEVARLAAGDDPAFNIVKTLVVDYAIGDQPCTARATDPETIVLASMTSPERIAELHRDLDGHLLLEAWKPGHYEWPTAAGPKTIAVSSLPEAVEVAGPWEVAFAPGGGAPAKVTFDELVSWPQHADPGVKYFSGVASLFPVHHRDARNAWPIAQAVPGSWQGGGHGPCHPQRQGPGNPVEAAVPGGYHRGRASGRKSSGGEDCEPLDQPDDRRRATARGQCAELQRHTQGVAPMGERGQDQPDRSHHVHDLEALEEG